ncbi:MAG: YncE family protein [Pseudomonadota bacterium]
MLLFSSCDGESISFPDTDGYLNDPISIVAIEKGTNHFLLVNNTNYELSHATGSISIIKYDTLTNEYTFLTDKYIEIDSFSGQMLYDAGNLYVANRNADTIDCYSVSFDASDAFNLIEENSSKGSIEVGENPYGISLSTINGDKYLLSSNITSGTLSLIDLASWSLIELDYEDWDDYKGVYLNTNTSNLVPTGRGAIKSALIQDGKFALVITKSYNVIFVVDVEDASVEGYIYTDNAYATESGGLRGISVDSNDQVYVSSRDGDMVYIIDGTLITDNGIDNDRIYGVITDSIPLGLDNPGSVILNQAEDTLYVLSSSNNKVEIIDLDRNETTGTIQVGNYPIEMTILGNLLYVSNFEDSTISVLDLTTNTVIKTIEN